VKNLLADSEDRASDSCEEEESDAPRFCDFNIGSKDLHSRILFYGQLFSRNMISSDNFICMTGFPSTVKSSE